MKRKIAVVLGIILLSAIVLAARWGLDEFTHRQVGGRLSFNAGALPSQDYLTGSFIAGWDTAKGGSLSIYHKSQPDKVLWQSLPGESFIAAARGRETVTESRGSYDIKDNLLTVCSDQTIDSLESASGAFTPTKEVIDLSKDHMRYITGLVYPDNYQASEKISAARS